MGIRGKNVLKVKEGTRQKQVTYCMIHLHKRSGIDKSIKTESRLVVARGKKEG